MDEEEYSARIAAAGGDPDELGRIADELRHVPGKAAASMRIEAIRRRYKIRLAGPGNAPTPTVMPSWLATLGIASIDGRSLYRYGVTEEGFAKLQTMLIERRKQLGPHAGRELAGQFILWAAEWFRRHYDGTGKRWDALGSALGVNCQWSDWRHLTDSGMRFWRLEPLKLNGIHHRLAAIARQGGFPVAAIERGGGWASRFLEVLVARIAGLPAPDLDAADPIADQLMEDVPETWRSREMRVVSAELALEVVHLRRLAESNGVPAGALVSAWLDRHRPDWRDELPLPVGSEAARSLIDGLMRAVTMHGGHDAVGCNRWMEIGPDAQREGVELNLAGYLRDASGKALTSKLADDWSRLRLYASGALAQHVSGELAVVDPDEESVWRARPTTTNIRFELPLDVAVTAELRGDGRRVVGPFVLAHGEPIKSEVRVYAQEGDGQINGLLSLRLIGTASGGYSADQVFVDLPGSWSIKPHGEGAASEEVPTANVERKLWQVTGATTITGTRGDRYLVRTGQKGGDRDRLLLNGDRVLGCELTDPGTMLVMGRPTARVQEGRRERPPTSDELWWRPDGARDWHRGIGPEACGPCEFAWRDRMTGHIRDRRDAVVMPQGFSTGSRRIGDWHEVQVEGWSGSITASAGTQHGPNCWRLPAKGNTRSRLNLTLGGAVGGSFNITVPLHHQAWIESWQDGPIRRNARLSLSTINRYVARADGRCELMADLLDPNGRPVPQGQASWWVDGELPMSSIRDDLAALLRPCGDIRARVRLNFNDSYEDYWFVGEFEHELKEDGRGLVPDPAVAEDNIAIALRALGDPTREHIEPGSYGLIDSLNHRPIPVPSHHGACLIYLRNADRVLSCPKIVTGAPPRVPPQTPLGRVMSLSDWNERQAALESLGDEILLDPAAHHSRAFVRQLVDLALSLKGLPPATFDALRLLCDRPLLGALMLFQARRDEIELLLRLAEGLPFAWWLIPQRAWYAAAEAQAHYLFSRIPDEPGLVAASIVEMRSDIASLEPVLSPLLEMPVHPEPLDAAANAFLNRSGDRIDTSISNPFRPRVERELPAWRFGENFWRALDAPIAAAIASNERISLTSTELACAKDVARKHPRWFREAFTAALKEG